MPARNGSPPEAPAGGHSTQRGATPDALAGEAIEADAPALVAAVALAAACGAADADGPAPVDVAAGEAAGVAALPVAAIAGRLTAPDDPDDCALPAIGGAVVAVCAAAGPASAISSGSAMRKGWAIPSPIQSRRAVIGREPGRSSPAAGRPGRVAAPVAGLRHCATLAGLPCRAGAERMAR